MAVKEYKVLTGVLVAKLDADGKRVKRYVRGALVKLDDKFNNVERLLELRAIGDKEDKQVSSFQQAAAANKAAQEERAKFVDSGEIAQGENDRYVADDDGGKGSDAAPAPGDTPPAGDQK